MGLDNNKLKMYQGRIVKILVSTFLVKLKYFLQSFVLLIFPASLAIGCQNVNPDFPLTFEFQLKEEAGNTSTLFEEGENFVFDFSITNHSDETLFFRLHSFNFEDFLKVYKIMDKEEGNGMIDKGKPYRFCAEIGGISISPGKTSFIMPWKAPNHYSGAFHCYGNNRDLLEKGNYYTAFTSSFTFTRGDETFTTDPLSFEIYFEIK